MRCKCLVSIFLLLAFFTGRAQSTSPKHSLNQLRSETERYQQTQLKRALDYAQRYNVPLDFYDHLGNHICLVGVDDTGLPIYYTTLNAGAALTTRASALRLGGTLGLNLLGRNITVGVWDDNQVKNHAEFGNRLLSKQGPTPSRHATHVTGTIIASGLDVNARGMAPMASAKTWDFNNDLPEMAAEATSDQSTLLFSNHSYSVLLGFFRNETGGWSWAGDADVSPLEDYRFGFYNLKSYYIDDIAYHAPYYTIIWSAGNERSDAGDGTREADGNNGTGYDCINPEGSSKNNITIGAVQKVAMYTNPSSVVMSGFSSWGPTDDGRIKPDLVAAGVSVYSPSVTAAGADTYSTFNGTSMAAPNATGSLALLQELYHDLHGGKYMRSATVKALAIHTAKEAGGHPGPDYRFGWGLLDVEAAAAVLLDAWNDGVQIMERTMTNNDTFEYTFQAMENTHVTATIVWTDVPGNSPEPQLDPVDLMLVNDLDMRITPEAGNEQFPWILNPTVPADAATKGDNIRDNVEKIEFVAPASQSYTLKVKHKGILETGSQTYSIVLTFTPVTPEKTTYYWVGNSGDWNDPAKWSLTSGGSPANAVPNESHRVVFDENSFAIANPVVTLSTDAGCASMSWRSKRKCSLSLSGHTLAVHGGFQIMSDSVTVTTAGNVELSGGQTSVYSLVLNNADFSKATFVINSADQSSWVISGNMKAGAINLQTGKLVAREADIEVATLIAAGSDERTLDITGSTIHNVSECTLHHTGLHLISDAATLRLTGSGAATVSMSDISFNGTLDVLSPQTTFSGKAFVSRLVTRGEITINDSNNFDELIVKAGSIMAIQAGTTQSLSEKAVIHSDAANRVALNTVGAGTSTLNFDGHYKLCYDYLDVTGINVEGGATINAGNNSTLLNSVNWKTGVCEDVLFADFSAGYPCVGALTEFSDGSDGDITSWSWNFGDPSSSTNTSSDQHPRHLFGTADSFEVTLTVSDGTSTSTVAKTVLIGANPLPVNSIILANQKLYSTVSADTYQWFRNDELIENENGRWLDYDGSPGAYIVVMKVAECSRPSQVFVITDTDEINWNDRVRVFPNPAREHLQVSLSQELLPATLTLTNSLGQIVLTYVVTDPEKMIPVSGLQSGFYVMDISGIRAIRKKILVTR